MANDDARKRRKDALAAALLAANSQTYLSTIRRAVQAFGQAPPHALTDPDVLEGLESRARASADSIVDTQDDYWDSLDDDDTLTAPERRGAFERWHVGQLAMIATYESALTASIALGDFVSKNGLSGTAHVEPPDTAGLDDSCDDAVALGEIPLADIPIDLPAHPRCPHAWVYSLDSDGSLNWMG